MCAVPGWMMEVSSSFRRSDGRSSSVRCYRAAAFSPPAHFPPHRKWPPLLVRSTQPRLQHVNMAAILDGARLNAKLIEAS